MWIFFFSLLAIGTAFAGYIQLTHEDIIYNSLPLYHSSGGLFFSMLITKNKIK